MHSIGVFFWIISDLRELSFYGPCGPSFMFENYRQLSDPVEPKSIVIFLKRVGGKEPF